MVSNESFSFPRYFMIQKIVLGFRYEHCNVLFTFYKFLLKHDKN